MRTILLTGSSGQIGSELSSALSTLGKLVMPGKVGLDLADADNLRSQLRTIKPDVIVNAAAYTAVDKAEIEPELAMQVNGIAPGILAKEAQYLQALLVHYSTDYVFDGAKQTPYVETDIPNPLSAYGRSKLAGERDIGAATSDFLILRTSWVYGAHGRNFLETIKRLGAERQELSIVDDQIGAPTWSLEIARATARIIETYLNHPDSQQLNGIYHLTAQGKTSWFDFAQAAVKLGLFSDLAQQPRLLPINTEQYPTPARRPANSTLSNAKLHDTFKISLPPWEDSLQEFLTLSTERD